MIKDSRQFDVRKFRPKAELKPKKKKVLPALVRAKYEELIQQKPVLFEKAVKVSKKTIAPFAASLLVLVLLLQAATYLSNARSAKGEILGAATNAYSDLTSASTDLKSQNFSNAQDLFESAQNTLEQAQGTLDNYKALQLLVPQAKSADHILNGAQLLAAAGNRLASSLDFFGQLKVDATGVAVTNIADKLKNNRDSFESTLFLLKSAQQEFDAASDLPAAYEQTLGSAKEQVGGLITLMNKMINLEDIYLGFFGNGAKTYLLVFENYDEVRAAGGFIGTYGVLKTDAGKIQSMKIDSIYDLDGQIYENIAAPGPFQPDIKKWGIRDTNWFADFPTSARKLLQFYEFGSETADGVIALTPQIFENILSLTGPIAMPDYGVTLTSENFQQIVQYKTSMDYDKALNEPKKMLADFEPILLDKLSNLSQSDWLNLLQMLQDNLNQKQILLYAKDSDLEAKILAAKFGGEILDNEQDYLDIVNTNLGGTKTDLSIKQSASLDAVINGDGSITDTLKITRANSDSELNKNFIRVMVPSGSQLVSSTGFNKGNFEPSETAGFKIDPDLANWDKGNQVGDVFVRSESGKTEFSGWNVTDAGQTTTLTLVYKIPYVLKTSIFDSTATYSLLFQKQDGVKPYHFTASLNLVNFRPRWVSDGVDYVSDELKLNYTTNSDQYWAALLSK